ncbi:MAG TPA: hypothetical protein VKB19_20150 [Pedobacter sp.]|nr:hypothetical protein [Pedobacter sp.]
MKRAIVIGSLAAVFLFMAFSRTEISPLHRLIDGLKSLAEYHPQEKVYLHTDRPWYNVGDTLWFKGYVTIGGGHHLWFTRTTCLPI